MLGGERKCKRKVKQDRISTIDLAALKASSQKACFKVSSALGKTADIVNGQDTIFLQF
jgi:hypothetical protein